MLKVTPAAQRAMCDFFKDKEFGPVRIVLKDGGCGIQFFDLEVDIASPGDITFSIGGYTFLVKQNLLENYSPILVDSDGFSFRLQGGGIHPPTNCGTCPFSCRTRGKTECTGDCINCSHQCRTGRRKLARQRFNENYMQ